MGNPKQWCSLAGWGKADFIDPDQRGYSAAGPAKEYRLVRDGAERILLYYDDACSYPEERRYVVVAGFRSPGAGPYTDPEGRQVVDIDLVSLEERRLVREALSASVPGLDIYFYGA